MRTRTRLMSSITVSIFISAIIACLVYFMLQQVKNELGKSRVYDAMIFKTNALNTLLADMKQDFEPTDLTQIRAVCLSLRDLLEQASSAYPAEQALIVQIRINYENLGLLIDQLEVSGTGMGSLSLEDRKAMIDTQLFIKVRRIADDVYRLSGMHLERVISIQSRNGIAVLLLLTALIVFNTLVFVISHRKIVQSEESLGESEERLKYVLEGSRDGFWDWNLKTGEVNRNERWAEMLGYSFKDIAFSVPQWEDLVHLDDRPRAWQSITDHLEGKTEHHECEYRMLHKSGEWVWILDRARVVKLDDDGKPSRMAGTHTDITERRKIEEQIRTSEETFKALVEGAPDALFVQTGGLFAYVNSQALKLFGAESHEQLLGKPVMDRFHPNFHETVRERIRLLNVEKKSPPTLDQIYLRMDGSEIHVEVSAVPIRFANQDGALVFARDITDRKLAEEALRESEQRYRAVVDNLHVGISVINRRMEIVAINRFFEAYYPEVRPGTGQTCYSAYNEHPRSSPCSHCPCLLTFQDGGVHECEIETPVGDKIRNYRITSCPVKDHPGGVQLVVELVEDITERKSLYSQLAQAQKMEALGTLAGGIAHDFNNLLQVIIGYSDFMLERKKEVGEDCTDLQKIYDAGQRGADLVKGLMAFSRQEQAKLVPVSLNDETKKIERLLYHTIPKNIVIELHLEQIPQLIKAEPSQIGQILMNLAINSKDAMPEGGKLVIETQNVTLDDDYCGRHIRVSPGSYVLMTVSDTGTGMDSETMSHIFEPFFTTKGLGKGTGLGLATVYGIVKQHNSHIFCYSEPGHGTTFKIYFPAIHGDDIPVCPSDDSATPGGTETILLVDDDENIRDLGARILEQKGYSVITAQNGKEGLEIYEKVGDTIGLVVLDLIMPEMDGKLCLEEILKINPGAKILLASGYSPNGSAKTLISRGARGFVNKPFLSKELLARIREALDT